MHQGLNARVLNPTTVTMIQCVPHAGERVSEQERERGEGEKFVRKIGNLPLLPGACKNIFNHVFFIIVFKINSAHTLSPGDSAALETAVSRTSLALKSLI